MSAKADTASADPIIATAGANDSVDLSELQPDTLRAEMANIQHSIMHLERSNEEMRQLIANAKEEGLEEEDVKELNIALQENVGVRQRKEQVHNKLAELLAELLGVDPSHFLLKKEAVQPLRPQSSAATNTHPSQGQDAQEDGVFL